MRPSTSSADTRRCEHPDPCRRITRVHGAVGAAYGDGRGSHSLMLAMVIRLLRRRRRARCEAARRRVLDEIVMERWPVWGAWLAWVRDPGDRKSTRLNS